MECIKTRNEVISIRSLPKISLKRDHPQAVEQLPTRGGLNPSSTARKKEITNTVMTNDD